MYTYVHVTLHIDQNVSRREHVIQYFFITLCALTYITLIYSKAIRVYRAHRVQKLVIHFNELTQV